MKKGLGTYANRKTSCRLKSKFDSLQVMVGADDKLI